MKNIYYLLLISISALLFSCSNDEGIDSGGGNSDNALNNWIEETMRKNYYWYKDIPESNNLNYNADPELFFRSLLSSDDGKPNGSYGHDYYSYMESSGAGTRSTTVNGEMSLGFEYNIYYTNRPNEYSLHILYILPNSPASRSELKRGEWIHTINDKAITMNTIKEMNSQTNIKLGVGKTTAGTTKEITLSAQAVEDNPVYIDTTYHYNGKKIGYLVYNHFTSGPNGNNDETFNNSLRKAFSKFKNNSPDDFILDLRYNNGGLVTCAQLLATLLAPQSSLNDIFCKLTYNDKSQSKNQTYTLDNKIIKANGYGENLNLKRLFVIIGGRTASASEAVINGLKPYLGDNIILIGDRTEGKNVGSLQYTDKRFDWILHPIVCLVSNKNNLSDYANGFTPDYKIIEPNIFLQDMGDTEEYMLGHVLNLITEGTIELSVRNSTQSETPKLLLKGSSLDRKKRNGVIVLPSEE